MLGNGGATGSITGNVTANAGGTFGVNRSDVYALPNLVTGAGNFAQLGPGTTVLGLDGMNYTGTTTIAAGVLQVGQGGSEGSIGTGEIINNATLAINKSSTFTLPNTISGTGIFNQIGTGTTVLTGTSTYSGATNVNSGVLQAGAANAFSSSSTHNVAARRDARSQQLQPGDRRPVRRRPGDARLRDPRRPAPTTRARPIRATFPAPAASPRSARACSRSPAQTPSRARPT